VNQVTDTFVNRNWVATRWQQYSTHLHTNSTQNDTKQTVHWTTQNKQYTERHKTNSTQKDTKQTVHWTTQKIFGRVRAVPRLCGFYLAFALQ